MVKYIFFKIIKMVCVLPNHGNIILMTYPDHIKVNTALFIPPNTSYELQVHEFGDDRNAKAIGKPILTIGDGKIFSNLNLIGKSIALSVDYIISHGVIGYAQ